MGCALELRRTFKDLGDDYADVATIRPVRLVAAWLTHAGGEALVPASVRLCATVLESPARDHLGTAWFAVHGLTLLDHITGAGIGITEGRATSEQAAYRARLKVAVTGINDAQLMSGTALAKRSRDHPRDPDQLEPRAAPDVGIRRTARGGSSVCCGRRAARHPYRRPRADRR